MGNRIKCELAGVVDSWTYSCFEALKVRDPRLETVSHYSYYGDIRGNLEYIGPLALPAEFSFPASENSACTYHLILLLKRANGFMMSESKSPQVL